MGAPGGCEQGLPPCPAVPENITEMHLGSRGVVSGHTVALGHLGSRGVPFNPRGLFQQHKWKEKAGRQDDKVPTLVRTGDGKAPPSEAEGMPERRQKRMKTK